MVTFRAHLTGFGGVFGILGGSGTEKSRHLKKNRHIMILIVFEFITFVRTVLNFRPLEIVQCTPKVGTRPAKISQKF